MYTAIEVNVSASYNVADRILRKNITALQILTDTPGYKHTKEICIEHSLLDEDETGEAYYQSIQKVLQHTLLSDVFLTERSHRFPQSDLLALVVQKMLTLRQKYSLKFLS